MVDKKTVWSVTNIALRLLVICLAVAAMTALVFVITEDAIRQDEQERKQEAIRLVFADAASFVTEPNMKGEGVNGVYSVRDAQNRQIGWCVDYNGNSDYGGTINMMIGVDPSGKVCGLQIISHAETFLDRYLDEKGCYTGVDLERGADLSAGATMSYNAIRNAMSEVEKLIAQWVDLPDGAYVVSLDDIRTLYANAASFESRALETLTVNKSTNAVYVVKDANSTTLGRCVFYTARGGFGGDMELLISIDDQSNVQDVLVMRHYADRMGTYLDEYGRYKGVDAVRGSDLSGGATKSYNAIRDAMEMVVMMRLGGVS